MRLTTKICMFLHVYISLNGVAEFERYFLIFRIVVNIFFIPVVKSLASNRENEKMQRLCNQVMHNII